MFLFYVERDESTLRLKTRFRMRKFPAWLCKWLSISKWKAIKKAVKEHGESVADGGNRTCAYCAVFFEDGEWSDSPQCIKCPIYIRTGEQYCDETPYDDYIEAESGSEEELDAIEREIVFLKETKI